MKGKALRKKTIFIILFVGIINVFSMFLWFNFKIKPIINMANSIKEEITENELADKYKNEDELLEDIKLIADKYNVLFRVKDINNNDLIDYDSSQNNSLLFSKGVKIDNNLYIINAYIDKRVNTLNVAFELIMFQIVVVTFFMGLLFLFARSKVIKPTERLIDDIRNYKLGKKPEIVEDVDTEIDLIQNEFVNLVETLEEEKKEQNRIIASISHDIKTPLTSIIGYSNLIEENNLTKQEILNYNKKIYNKSLHIKGLLNTFDEYINNHNNQNLKISEITIKELVDEINNDYKIELENNGIKLMIDTKLSKEILKVDVLKLKRIFSNMISNSVRFLKNKGEIRIEITKDKDNYRFVVSDNGPGVDEKIIDKIFEPLFTTDDSRKNSGLGLSICKEFVLMHEGGIKAYNNQGLSIEFTIPINR
ncbi:MAG: sensor histidine kinase [Bacilli bacterium]